MGDFIFEARDKGLYRFVTDNGAGGLSSSVGEMAGICGGCVMDLKKAPLKYAGMQPWEILISEAQERMSFAVPPENLDAFLALAADRDVEATVLGNFTDDGKFRMMWGEKTVCCLDIEFMHEGLPRLQLAAKWKAPSFEEPVLDKQDAAADLAGKVHLMGDDDHRHAAFGQHAHGRQHLADHRRIERRRWLVKEHDLRLHHQAASNRHALLLAAGEIGRHGVELI